jgi:hypothetical protein
MVAFRPWHIRCFAGRLAANDPVLDDLLAPRPLQGIALQVKILLGCRNSRIADGHAPSPTARVKNPVGMFGSGLFAIKRPNRRSSKQNGRILLANSRGRSFGRKLGEMRRPGEANPAFPAARDEFANSIRPFVLRPPHAKLGNGQILPYALIRRQCKIACKQPRNLSGKRTPLDKPDRNRHTDKRHYQRNTL